MAEKSKWQGKIETGPVGQPPPGANRSRQFGFAPPLRTQSPAVLLTAGMSDPANPNPELDNLKAQVQALRDSERRLMDTVKVSAGLMLGLSAVLVVFSWFASHKNYEHDKQTMQKALEAFVEQRQAAVQRELVAGQNARFAGQDQAVDRKLAELSQVIRAQLAGLTNSITNAQVPGEDVNRKIQLMAELIERRSAHPFGLLYFDYAIRAANAKNFPAATEYFLAAGVAFLRSNDELNLNTSIARVTQLGLPNLRVDDFTARPALEEKFTQLTDALDKANLNGKYTVALGDLRREYGEARKRTKAR